MISIIAAIGKNNELGKDNHLIWNIPNDLKFFKKVTINHTIVMGRKTYESLGRVLPNRYNIVVTKSIDKISGAEIVNNIEDVLHRFKDTSDDVYIIGGSSLYNYFLEYADKLYLTEIDAEEQADVYFPIINREIYDKTILDEVEENNIKYKHVLYKRKK